MTHMLCHCDFILQSDTCKYGNDEEEWWLFYGLWLVLQSSLVPKTLPLYTPSIIPHQEELYAWGNPAAEHLPILPPENTRAQLAKAAWRWRAAINGSGGSAGQRPFQHMVALVHSTKDRTGAFSRMIKAGGGEVVAAK